MILRRLAGKLLGTGAVLTTSVALSPRLAASFSVMAQGEDPTKAANIYGFKALDIDGNEVSMEKYRGHVCVVVNVASQ